MFSLPACHGDVLDLEEQVLLRADLFGGLLHVEVGDHVVLSRWSLLDQSDAVILGVRTVPGGLVEDQQGTQRGQSRKTDLGGVLEYVVELVGEIHEAS